MPIYEFVCQECGNEFERIQSWSDSSTPVCTVCAGSNVVRRISPPAIHFKGSGWYVTDSKKGNKNGAIDHGSNGSNGSNGNNGDGEAKKTEVKETSAKSAESVSGSAGKSASADKAGDQSKSKVEA